MELSTRYSPSGTEDKWYQHWMDKGYFYSTPDEREAYTIVIPPPNVTGVLHMGHMLNNTIQDILIRKARLQGFNACWVPGTDHASIATEAKVVRMLREQGIKKSDISRDKFMEYAWEWKEKYGGIILEQLKKLGASCDWKRTAFTMDEPRSEHVLKAFVDLYNSDKLYRKLRMVNWDPEAKTVLSNEEVIYKEENSKLYQVRYQIEGSEEFVTIATTRPETILGDTAIAVHPDDARYTHLKGKQVIVPLIGRAIPIVFDDYVDIEFGTGALKITPAHDQNDYAIGQKHGLETIDILNEDGSLNDTAQLYIGVDRFKARKLIAKDLEAAGNLVSVEDYRNNVGRSERTNCIIEPRLSLQWYVDMKSLAKPALDAVMSDEIEFFPKKEKNKYAAWMNNIMDWCISRQLWWGHRIPAWYYGEEVFVAKTAAEALAQAQEKLGKADLTIEDLKQEDDVLDTWFSSWLWPISVFDGFNPENKAEFDYYYPTNVLVTGWDIIFLWVARMAMSGYEWEDKFPFKDVYFTGMVRDQQRRKMSKSLGNSPDALKLIEQFGADGVRYGMLSSSPAGGDLLFDEKLCDQGAKFCNKMWNALRLMKSFQVEEKPQDEINALAGKWIRQRFNEVLLQTNEAYKDYRLSENLMSWYKFAWNDLFAWYLEIIKPAQGESLDATTFAEAIAIFEQYTIVLHPFMPFLTEEIWHSLKTRAEGEDCIVSTYPETTEVDTDLLKHFAHAQDVISNIRNIRSKNNLKQKAALKLFFEANETSNDYFSKEGYQTMIVKMAYLESLESTTEEPASCVSFLAGTSNYYVELDLEIDVTAEKERLSGELEYTKGFLAIVNKKLSNERFVNNAPDQVVASERKKQADAISKIKTLEEALAKLA